MNVKPTILIADDDRVSLALLSKLVEQLNYNVLRAENGGRAFEIVRSETVDLVIADYDMPGLNGLDLLSKVKASFPRLPFILVTAYSNLTVIRQAWEAGAFDFFQKPVYVDRLQQTIRLAIEYGHLAIARRKFPKTEGQPPDPSFFDAGVIRELAAALDRDDLLRIVEEFETHARIELEQVFRYSMVKDAAQVKSFAHRLSGAATNLGLIKVANMLKDIENNPAKPITDTGNLAFTLEQSIHWLNQHLTQVFSSLAV